MHHVRGRRPGAGYDPADQQMLVGQDQGCGQIAAARTGCFGKETSNGTADPSCHQKASDKFSGGGDPTNATNGIFNKLEAKYPIAGTTPCLTFGDQSRRAPSPATLPACMRLRAAPWVNAMRRRSSVSASTLSPLPSVTPRL